MDQTEALAGPILLIRRFVAWNCSIIVVGW
jgi:hypothetical protein